MSDVLKELEEQAKALTAAWDREIRERTAAYERGELKTIAAEDLFAEARRLAK